MGTAAAISTSHLSYSASDQDPALIFDVIVSVVIGGTSLSGGFGSIWRTAAGLSNSCKLQNGLNLLQVNTIAQYVVKGSSLSARLAWMCGRGDFARRPNSARDLIGLIRQLSGD